MEKSRLSYRKSHSEHYMFSIYYEVILRLKELHKECFWL